MPFLNTARLRQWLVEHDKVVRDLAEAADIPHGTLKNNIGGRSQMRWGRVKALARATGMSIKVLVAPGTVVPPWLLADEEEAEGTKVEKTHPDKRKNGGGSGPKRPAGAAA